MLSRRHFMMSSATIAVGFAGLRTHVRVAQAGGPAGVADPDRFGPLLADPHRIFDLPAGFSYRVISRTGDPMDDGLLVPGKPDGMAAFAGPDGQTVIVCNHEMENDWAELSPFGKDNALAAKLGPTSLYDATPGPALGGTSTIHYDTRTGQRGRHFMSLAGTVRNCAGGPTPWGSWISCEETVVGPAAGYGKWHGYNFEVPCTATSCVEPVPLVAMGRFNHEAIAVDPRTGIVYQTEDRNDGLIYRFIPRSPGNLAAGGRLQALAVRNRKSLDLRNWDTPAELFVGQTVETDWIDVLDPTSPADDMRYVHFEAGAARFARGEGMWFGRGSVFFACTNGGVTKDGQIWRYVPSPFEGTPDERKYPGRLELFVEPNDSAVVRNADNLTVSPAGELFVCEDKGGGDCRILCVAKDGRVSTFARNAFNDSELSGVCFSPDGTTLFVNIQHNPGMTLAVTGPFANPTRTTH